MFGSPEEMTDSKKLILSELKGPSSHLGAFQNWIARGISRDLGVSKAVLRPVCLVDSRILFSRKVDARV
jgi:hypothetical protein